MHKSYDIIVIGGGHAGIEAALVSSRKNLKTLLITLSISSIGKMSCNPAIGGVAKGQLVRELDALGGEMAQAIDNTGIHFSMLNTSKGPAVQSPRAQADKYAYQKYMEQTLLYQDNLDIFEGELTEILVKNLSVYGVKVNFTEIFYTQSLILTTGTFLNAIMHIGNEKISGGRKDEKSAQYLSRNILDLGFELGRLKTGTPPRVHAHSIDFSKLLVQKNLGSPFCFSYRTEFPKESLADCYITYSNLMTHDIIRENLSRSPMYSGQIQSLGPRYCPSIEDKVFRFPEKEKHQIFLEPESLITNEIYLNGLSTSLPKDVQEKFLKSIPGFQNVKIIYWGYAVEYDFIFPHQISSTMETKHIKNLFLAGQINGTSGYEEAAAQGFIAGLNAVHNITQKDPFVLDRTEAYIGVLIDDLVTKNIKEPYRMFTSRAEYRLYLRYDNADERLMHYGKELGLIHPNLYEKSQSQFYKIDKAFNFIKSYSLKGTDILKNPYQSETGGSSLLKFIKKNIEEGQKILNLIKGLHSDLETLNLEEEDLKKLYIKIIYEGYMERQKKKIEKFKKSENSKIPDHINYDKIKGLLTEAREKLKKFKPKSIGQASRLEGVNPSDIDLILISLKK